jgi:hypothetical protein
LHEDRARNKSIRLRLIINVFKLARGKYLLLNNIFIIVKLNSLDYSGL